jgi:hypothetical protein
VLFMIGFLMFLLPEWVRYDTTRAAE